MRKLTALMLGVAVVLGLGQNTVKASSPNETLKVEIPVKALLTPLHGFEEKNNVQVVLYGALPNACYSLGEAKVEADHEKRVITIRQYAIKQTDGVCAQEPTMADFMKMRVPFTSEVTIGHLAAGDYHLLFNQQGNSQGIRSLSVSPNVTPLGDTLPYAMVSSAVISDVVNGADDVVVTLTGVLNSTCTQLDQNVRVLNEGDVFVVMPTIRVEKGVMCAQALIPFEKQVNLGKTVPGLHLIHTRSMNGKSVNKVIHVAR